MKITKSLSFFLLLFTLFNQTYAKKVKLGIDVLIETNFDLVINKKILLFTNYTGRNSEGKLTVEILKEQLKENLLGLLTPEHGFYSAIPAGQTVPNDSLFGLPVYSLYNNNRKPSKEILENCQAIVIDIQDIGIRSYTYISTLFKIMESGLENNIEIIILDRPNPLGGLIVDGNIVEKGYESFVGIAPIPYIHGCTIAELAYIANEEGWISKTKNKKVNLKIVKMKNWFRWMVWEDTQLLWYPTSPNITTVDAIRGSATIGVFGELGIFSIGIGTAIPFQYIGSPNFSPQKILDYLNLENIKGLRLIPTQYYPMYGMYKDKICKGFLMKFEPDNKFLPYTSGFHIVLAIKKAYPDLFNNRKISENAKRMFIKVTGNELIYKLLFEESNDDKLIEVLSKGVNDFIIKRGKYLIYD